MSRPIKIRKHQGLVVVGTAAHAAVVERLKRRTMGAGSFSAPCLPALTDHYVAKAVKLFDVLDRPLQGVELAEFRAMLKDKLEEGFETSPHTRFILSYGPDPQNPLAITYTVSLFVPTLEQQIAEWVETSKASEPFGKHADAKVLEVAKRLQQKGPVRVLDVGAGTGRNSAPLARMGLAVDAIEPVAQFAGELRALAAKDELPLTVIEADVLQESTDLSGNDYQLIVLSEVVTHFSDPELKSVLPRLARAMSHDGALLFNAFVARTGYQPDALARQASSSVWSTFFTHHELRTITESAGLTLVSDEPVLDYEEARHPAEAWPPTSWYVPWARGNNLFATSGGVPPVELRWLLYRASAD